VEEIREAVPLFEMFHRQAEVRRPDALPKLKFNEAVRNVLNLLVTDLIENTVARVRAAGIQDVEGVRRHPERLVAFSPEVEEQRDQLRRFLYERLYLSPDLKPEKDTAERTVRELFEYWTGRPQALPASYREKTRHEPLPRVVCDYIAGMTDNFIQEQYAALCGNKRPVAR
jgi:dGTPase